MKKPPPPPPLKIAKDKPYCFGGWQWRGGEWTPLFRERLWAKKERKQAWKDQTSRLEELNELLDRSIDRD